MVYTRPARRRVGAAGARALPAGGAGPGDPLARIEDAAAAGDRALVHDETSANEGFVYGLANLDYPDFPLPLGVLRAIEQPTYEELVAQQIEEAQQHRGPGDLEALLDAGECWTVE